MRKIAVALVVLAFVVVGGWTAVWFTAAHEAGVRFDAWLKSEDMQGRDWRCPDRVIAGYPFALTIGCTKPTFTGRAPDQTVNAQAAALEVEASLAHPRRLAVTLVSPLSYKTSDGAADLTATWSRLVVDIDGPTAVSGLALHGADLAVDGTFGDSGRQGGRAGGLDARFAFVPGSPTPGALDFAIAVDGVGMPPLDDLLGGDAPVDFDLNGRLTLADLDDPRTPAEAIDQGRQAGRQSTLGPSSATRGASSVNGSGTLRLDEAHRPQGRLDASFVGLEPILKRYGISGNLAAAGSLLSTLFGGGRPQAPTTPGALNLPISLQNGFLGIGPIRTQIALAPLY